MRHRVRVLRTPGWECTNNGISARHDDLIALEEVDCVPPVPDGPTVVLMTGPLGHPVLRPLTKDGTVVHGMMGGNFAESSDSRWDAAVAAVTACLDVTGEPIVLRRAVCHAVPIHDRVEGARS